MDLSESRGYFDAQVFDAYNFGSSTWALKAFSGQLDLANPKVSLMNKGTRRRMLYVSPGQEPTSSVIRDTSTGQVFLVGQQSKDTFVGDYLRDVVSLHLVKNTALVYRKAPAGPSNNPGWAVNSLIETTFADYEFRSDNQDQLTQINQWGSYELSLPTDSMLQMHDTVTIEGQTFYVFAVFNDSGLKACHATNRPDDRVDFVYHVLSAKTYDPATLRTGSTDTPYNVTGEITPYIESQEDNSAVTKTRMKVMIKRNWIGVEPQLNDLIVYLSQKYRVTRVALNKLQDEWHLVVDV